MNFSFWRIAPRTLTFLSVWRLMMMLLACTSSLNWYSAKSVLLGGTERVIRLKFTKLQSNDFYSFVCNLFSIEFFSLYFVTDKKCSLLVLWELIKLCRHWAGGSCFPRFAKVFLNIFAENFKSIFVALIPGGVQLNCVTLLFSAVIHFTSFHSINLWDTILLFGVIYGIPIEMLLHCNWRTPACHSIISRFYLLTSH